MARIPLSLIRLAPGALAAGAVVAAIAVSLVALARAGEESGASLIDGYVLQVAAFTFLQAVLSAILSLVPGIVVARAFARRTRFPGRRLLLRLFALPLVLPVIVAIFGIAGVFGAGGAVASLARWLDMGRWSFPYGLPGILIAHCFFNFPLAVRLLLPALEAIPGETLRLAAQLGMSDGQLFRRVEWPVLRRALPGAGGLIFLLCFTSFAVVLVFGGGPAATTLEVAIFQALRLDFDVDRAVALSLLQVLICTAMVGAGHRILLPAPLQRTEARPSSRPGHSLLSGRLWDAAWILAAAVFAGGPLLSVLLHAALGPWNVVSSPAFRDALLRTLAVGLSAGCLSLLLGVSIGLTVRDLRMRRGRPRIANWLESVAFLNLVVSPIVLGAGLFVLLLPSGLVFAHPLPLVGLVAAFSTVPYVVQTLGPALDRVVEHHERPCLALGIRGWNRLRIVEWPLLRPGLARAYALAAGISMGDLTSVALFGTDTAVTLPLLLYRLMAAYRMEEAGVVAGLLALLCLGGFWLLESLGERRARD